MNTTPMNVYQTRVRSHQTDLNAAMYHGAYFDLFDDARIERFRQIGYTYQTMLEGGWTAVIRRLEAEFYAPAWMDDEIRVVVDLPTFRRATMTVGYRCLREDTLLAVGIGVYAFLNPQRRPLRVPADLVEIVERNANALAGTT